VLGCNYHPDHPTQAATTTTCLMAFRRLAASTHTIISSRRTSILLLDVPRYVERAVLAPALTLWVFEFFPRFDASMNWDSSAVL
jgi:hypothetical protein